MEIRKLSNFMFKEVHAWLSDFMLFVRQVFVVNHVFKSFANAFNIKKRKIINHFI